MATTYFCNLLIIRDTADKKLTSFYSQTFNKFPTETICIGSSVNADIIVKSLQPEHVNIYFQKTALFMNAKANTQLNTSSMRDTFVSGAMRIPFSRESLDLFRWQIKITPHLYIAGQIHKENVTAYTLENKIKQKYGLLRKICEKEYISYRLGTRYVVQIPSPSNQDCSQQITIAKERKQSKCEIFPYIKHINEDEKFIISEYFHGTTLENYRGQNGLLSDSEVAIIAKNICKYLDKLGECKVVLTPDNILVDHNNEIRITGLSTRIKGRYHYYNPPECMFDDMPQDLLANIYTLGALLFELLSGRNLFNSLDEYQEAVKTNTNPNLKFLDDVPVRIEVKDLVKKMLLFSRKDRVSHMDVVETLERLTQKDTDKPSLMEKLEHIENIQKTTMRRSSPLEHINSIIDNSSGEIDYSKQMQTSVRQPPKLGKNRTQAFVSPNQDENTPDAVHQDMLETSIRPVPGKENAFAAIYDEFNEKQTVSNSQRTQHGVSTFLRSNKKEINEFNKKSRYVVAGAILCFAVILIVLTNPFSTVQSSKKTPQKITHKKTTSSQTKKNFTTQKSPSTKKVETTTQHKKFLRSIQTSLYVLQPPSQKYLNGILKQITIDIGNYSHTPIAGDLYNITARLYLYKIHLDEEEQLFEPFWKKEWWHQVKLNMQKAQEAYRREDVVAQLQLVVLPWMPEKKYVKSTAIVYRNNKDALKEINTWLNNLVKNR